MLIANAMHWLRYRGSGVVSNSLDEILANGVDELLVGLDQELNLARPIQRQVLEASMVASWTPSSRLITQRQPDTTAARALATILNTESLAVMRTRSGSQANNVDDCPDRSI